MHVLKHLDNIFFRDSEVLFILTGWNYLNVTWHKCCIKLPQLSLSSKSILKMVCDVSNASHYTKTVLSWINSLVSNVINQGLSFMVKLHKIADLHSLYLNTNCKSEIRDLPKNNGESKGEVDLTDVMKYLKIPLWSTTVTTFYSEHYIISNTLWLTI